MKKLIMLAIALWGTNSFAAETLRTRTYCVDTAGNMTSQVVQGDAGVYIPVGDATLWPQMVSGKKILLLTKKGQKNPVDSMDLGDSKSSSTYVEVPQTNGVSVRCHVLLEKVPAKKTFSIIVM